MNKKEIAAFFDRMAPTWDEHMVTDDAKLALILDTAGVTRNCTVLESKTQNLIQINDCPLRGVA